ncbi:MAG: hypothetical protein RRY64_08880, partial [Oscillospiraceae bacterium]
MFKKLATLILTGALCAALILPALAAEMTFPLGNDGASITLSDVVSTETKTVFFDGSLHAEEKVIAIQHLAPGCIATFNSCEPTISCYSMNEGAYSWCGNVLRCGEKFLFEGNPGVLMVANASYY